MLRPARSRAPALVLVLMSVWAVTLTDAVRSRTAQDTAELSDASIMATMSDAPESGGEHQGEDTSALKAKPMPNDPFLPATNLVKLEENATARIPFTGPYRDIDTYVHKRNKEIAKEVFGGSNEMQLKAERIQDEKKDLKKTASSEMKALNISKADANSPVGSKPVDENKPRDNKRDAANNAKKKADAVKKKAAEAKEASKVIKSKRGTRGAAINKVKQVVADAIAKFDKRPCVDESCAKKKPKELGEHGEPSKAKGLK